MIHSGVLLLCKNAFRTCFSKDCQSHCKQSKMPSACLSTMVCTEYVKPFHIASEYKVQNLCVHTKTVLRYVHSLSSLLSKKT